MRILDWRLPHSQLPFRESKPIVLFASRMDFARNNITGNPGEGTGGVTDFLRHRNMVFFTGETRGVERVLMHEMVHVFKYDIFSQGGGSASRAGMSGRNRGYAKRFALSRPLSGACQ